VILLHRIQDDYVTLRDVYRTTISPQQLEGMLIATGRRFNGLSYIAIAVNVYAAHAETLAGYGFALHADFHAYIARHTPEMERFLIEHTAIEAMVYTPKPFLEEKRLHWESLDFWYWEHWKFFRHEVKSSIVQGGRHPAFALRGEPRCTPRLLSVQGVLLGQASPRRSAGQTVAAL
jgi:hypothetical protein